MSSSTPEQFDFLRYMDAHSIEYVTQAGNLSKGWLAALNCPFCNETNHKLGIPAEGNRSYCWSCSGHSLYSTLKQLTPNLHYEDLIEQYSGYIDRRKTWGKKTAQATELEFNFAPLGKVARKYLIGRNFNPDYLQEKYNLRDGGLVDPHWKYRIIAPIYQDGILVSYQGRDYTNKQELRYNMLPVEMSVVNAKHCLYNIDNCKEDYCVVAEGVYDVFRWGDDCLATLGTSVSEEQCRKFLKFKHVMFLFDDEPQAQDRAKKLAQRVSALGVPKVEVINHGLGWETDMGAMSEEQIEHIKKELLN